MPQPSRTDHPHLPEGYVLGDVERTLLPWEHARQRLTDAQAYWIGTATPDGRPFASPVWGVWVEETLFFDGSPETRRGRNLAANPHVVIHLDSGGAGKDVVILYGEAHEQRAAPPPLREALAAAYTAKYRDEGYAPGPETWEQGGLYRVAPRTVLAWTDFTRNATRWHF